MLAVFKRLLVSLVQLYEQLKLDTLIHVGETNLDGPVRGVLCLTERCGFSTL